MFHTKLLLAWHAFYLSLLSNRSYVTMIKKIIYTPIHGFVFTIIIIFHFHQCAPELDLMELLQANTNKLLNSKG